MVLLFPRRKYDVFLGLCVAAGLLLYTVSPDTLFVSYDWGMLRACFSFFAGCLVYDLRLRSGDRLKAPNLLEAGCLLLVIAFAVTTPSGGWQFAFPLAAMILIYVFSFDQGAISTVLRSPALQKLGLWSYSIYMIHTFIFHVMKMGVTFVAQKAKLDLVIWHNDEKLVLLGTPEQALLPALHPVRRPRRARRRPDLSLDRKARDGRGPARAFRRQAGLLLVCAQASWSAPYAPRSGLALPPYAQAPGPALPTFERNGGAGGGRGIVKYRKQPHAQ